MKNNLLITTALVSVAFAFTANAAEDTATHKVTKEGELTVSGTLDSLHAGDKTDAQGGAVFHSGAGTLEVKDGTTFSNNYAQQTGGAISAYGDVNIGDNVTFKNNTSIVNEKEPKFDDKSGTIMTEMGGAIYVEGTGSEGKRKLTIGKNATFSGNKAANGIVYLYNGVTAEIGDNVSFVDNEMGAVLTHATNTKDHPVGGSGALTLVGSENNKNKVTVGNNALFARNIADYGAGVINDQYGELEFKDNATFSANTARGEGGAISNVGTLTFGDNATFIGNKAEGTLVRADEQPVYGEGGAIINSGNLTFNGTSTFKNNQAKYGGAIFASKLASSQDGNTNITFKSDALFDNNTASEFGGALYLNDKDTKVTFEKGATFINNLSSKGPGGAIRNNGTLELNGDTVFLGNRDKDGLNDIYNISSDAKITVKDGASLTLDGGITGSEGTLNLEKGSTLSVNNNTVIESKTKIDNGNGESVNLKLRLAAGSEDKSFDLNETFKNGTEGFESLSKNLNVKTDNNLYNIVETEEGKYIATQKSAGEVASILGVTGGDAGMILGMMNADTESGSSLNKVQNALAEMAQAEDVDSEAVSRAADALGADGAPVVRTHATMLSNMIFDTADEALSDTLQNATVGQSSGDSVFEKAKIWVKGLFNYADKDDTSKAHGFDMDTYGAAMGVDKEVGNGKVGLGYAYSKSDIDGYTRNTDVKTHTAFVYGQYQPADWYVKGVAAYSWSDYKEKKSVLGENADSKYDVDTLSLQGMFGYNFHVENDYDVTPEAGLRYLRASQDASTNALGVRVKARDIDVLTAVAGVKVAKNFALTDSLTIRPEVRAALTYDLDADNNDSIVTMGNTSYRVNGEKLERFGYELGAKLATDVTSNWEVAAGYEGRFRDEYQDHTGMLSAKYKF